MLISLFVLFASFINPFYKFGKTCSCPLDVICSPWGNVDYQIGAIVDLEAQFMTHRVLNIYKTELITMYVLLIAYLWVLYDTYKVSVCNLSVVFVVLWGNVLPLIHQAADRGLLVVFVVLEFELPFLTYEVLLDVANVIDAINKCTIFLKL